MNRCSARLIFTLVLAYSLCNAPRSLYTLYVGALSNVQVEYLTVNNTLGNYPLLVTPLTLHLNTAIHIMGRFFNTVASNSVIE